MPSESKSDTARANGAKSHGPKSAETRAISSQNALKHGLTSRHTTVLRCENAAEFQDFIAAYVDAYHPANTAQEYIVNEMVWAGGSIRRIRIVETALIDLEMTNNQATIEKKYNHPDSGIHMAESFRTIIEDSRSLSLVSRYESRLVRLHDRAYRILRELQKAGPPVSSQPAAPAEPEPEPLPPLPSTEVALDPAAPAPAELKNDEANPPHPCSRPARSLQYHDSTKVPNKRFVPVRRSLITIKIAHLAAKNLLRRK